MNGNFFMGGSLIKSTLPDLGNINIFNLLFYRDFRPAIATPNP